MVKIEYTAEVQDGLLLMLPSEAQELHLKSGDRVRIQLTRSESPVSTEHPNHGMLAALDAIASRQIGRRHSDGMRTDQMLREARAGSMWSHDPGERYI